MKITKGVFDPDTRKVKLDDLRICGTVKVPTFTYLVHTKNRRYVRTIDNAYLIFFNNMCIGWMMPAMIKDRREFLISLKSWLTYDQVKRFAYNLQKYL